jgi:hypothetical protein
MKKLFNKKFRIGKLRSMLAGGFGKFGPYLYFGVKTKKGASIGASVGTKGRHGYASLNKKSYQTGLRYNFETKKLESRFKLNRKRRL